MKSQTMGTFSDSGDLMMFPRCLSGEKHHIFCKNTLKGQFVSDPDKLALHIKTAY